MHFQEYIKTFNTSIGLRMIRGTYILCSTPYCSAEVVAYLFLKSVPLSDKILKDPPNLEFIWSV